MQHTFHAIDPAQLTQMGDLQLLARTVVEGLLTGLHRSPHSGSSIEFAQYRPYAQGDDLRMIDWHLFGRTDRLHIKQYQEETNLRCTLLLDCSASMDYASDYPSNTIVGQPPPAVTKFDYARMLTACLAWILHRQRDAAGFIAYHHDLIKYMPPRTNPQHVRQMLVELDRLEPEGSTDTPKALHYLGDVLQPRGMLVLVTDLLHPVEELVDHLKSLRARRHDLLVLHISDPAEQTFPFDKTLTFVDAESGREQYAVPDGIREQYLENRRSHFEYLRKECLASEIDIEEFTTSEPLDRALHFFLQRRTQGMVTSGGSRQRSVAGGR